MTQRPRPRRLQMTPWIADATGLSEAEVKAMVVMTGASLLAAVAAKASLGALRLLDHLPDF